MRALKRLTNAALALAIALVAACNNQPATPASADTTPAVAEPDIKVIPFDVVHEYPHDPMAFTEGLEYHDGILYEGTGEYGESDVRKTDVATGKILAQQKMDGRFFGEGVTVLNGKLYQLTYKEGKGFVYDAATLKKLQEFRLNTAEGWGMTNNGTHLIYDDGTNVLHFIDPNTFAEVKTLKVTDDRGPVNEINELELIKGYLYANQWQTDLILKIDTSTGRVVGRADLSSLRQRVGIPQPSGRRHSPEVMNGIAYDTAGNRIFITGKYWPKILEIKLDN